MCIRDRSSAAWATRVTELGRVARGVLPPAAYGLLSVAEAWAVIQARQLLEHTGWPAIAEFTIDETGQG
eukprot:9185910-Alexandrium_andersonii.AAC.1